MNKRALSMGLICGVSLVGGCRWLDPAAAVGALCDERGKYEIYDKVSAEGLLIRNADTNYVGYGVFSLFQRTGLTFIEVPSSDRGLPFRPAADDVAPAHADHLFSKKFIRIYLATAGSADCIRWKDRPSSSGGWGEQRLASSNQCIAAVPVDESAARYVASVEPIKISASNISSVRYSIRDAASGKAIAEAVNFLSTTGTGKFRSTASCRGHGTKFLNHDFSTFALAVLAFPKRSA